MNMKITDEMRTIWKDSLGADNAIQSMAKLIIAQYESEKTAAAAPEPFKITSLDQKVQFRDGTPARLLAVDLASPWPVVAADESGGVHVFSRSGRNPETSKDLIPITPAKRFAYVNVYPYASGGVTYDNRAQADAGADKSCTGCNRIELQEGVWHD
jgi:hypothetical protein